MNTAPTNWQDGILGDFIELKRGYDLPKRDRVEGTYPIISSSGYSGTHNEFKVTGPGVITGRYGTIGEVHWASEDYWPLNTALYVRDFKNNSERYFYYFLKTLNYQQFLDKAAVPGINRNDVHREPVRLPPLPEQKAIAQILGALDDKIELNRQTNKTLEAMARAIFKSWFVDFDPVHAKRAARDGTQSDTHTAALSLSPDILDLFPDSFQDSDLGEIPAGWEALNIGDVYEFKYGKPLKQDDRISGEYAVYGSNGIVGTHNEKLIDGPGVIIGRKGNPGIVKWSQGDFYPIDTTFYVEPKKEKSTSLQYAFFLLENVNLPRLSSDSAVPGLNRDMAYGTPILLATASLISKFEDIISTINKKTSALAQQIEYLSSLRDTLLPKLISGELHIKGAEKFLKDAPL